MQLKRDTDYALRILLCMGEHARDRGTKGLALRDISALAGLPRLSAERLCRRLEAQHILRQETGVNSEVRFLLNCDLHQLTLLNIVEATEGGIRLFAVFDKAVGMYRRYGERLLRLQLQVEHILSGTTVDSLLSDSSNRPLSSDSRGVYGELSSSTGYRDLAHQNGHTR